MEARLTDSANFMASRRYPIGHDFVSKVSESGKPELVTDVNPLSEREQLIFVLKTREQLSLRTVAQILGEPEATIARTFSRAVAKLQAINH